MNFLDLLREEFQKNLERKTGWGRVEVMTEFDKASIAAMMKYAALKGIELL